MRPPVSVPTLSRRAKLVIGAIAVLLVLFTVIGTLTNVYVDYLWFDETKYTEVFWTELQTRVLLFAVAGIATGGLVALAVYLAYRFRPTFRPMSLEQQNLERYRQSLEPRRGLVLTAVAVVLGLFAGFTAQGSWQTWLTFRNSTDFGRTDPQFGKDLSFFVFDYPFYRLGTSLRLPAPWAPPTRSWARTCPSSSSTTPSTGWCSASPSPSCCSR